MKNIKVLIRKMQTKISIIIPVLNEEGNIVYLLDEIKHKVPDNIEYEVIVVDDFSTDNTIKALNNYTRLNKNFFLVEHKSNYGQSASLLTGIRNARYDCIVTLDGDGQNDPADIKKLLKKFDNNQDFMMVIGNRVNRNDSIARKVASRVAFKVRKIILKDSTPDTGCAIKVFRKKDFLTLPFFNHIHRFLPFLFNSFGGKIVSIPVNHRSRKSGISKYSNFQRFLVGVSDILGVIWLKKRAKHPINYKKINNSK